MYVEMRMTRTFDFAGEHYEIEPVIDSFEVPDDTPMSEVFKKVASKLPWFAEELGTPYPVEIEITLWEREYESYEGELRKEIIARLKEFMSKINPPFNVCYGDCQYRHDIGIIIPCNENLSLFEMKRILEQG